MKYVIDTSALIDAQLYYPPDSVDNFWDNLIQLNSEGKLIVISKVKEEIGTGNDYLANDFIKKVNITSSETEDIIKCMTDLVGKVPAKYRQAVARWKSDADPFVIAAAMSLMENGEEVILVHGETENGNKLRIPMVCQIVNVPNDRVHKIIQIEKITI